MSVRDIIRVLNFGRQIIKEMHGLIKSKQEWRISAKGIAEVYKKRRYVKAQRMIYWEKLDRMGGVTLVRKVNDLNPEGIRTKGRPKYRWRYEVKNDLKKLKLRNWSQILKDKEAWNNVMQKTNPMLFGRRRRRRRRRRRKRRRRRRGGGGEGEGEKEE